VASANGNAYSALPRQHDAMRFMSTLILLCCACGAEAATPTVFVDDVRVHEGDDPAWAAPGLDDRAWPEQSAYRVDPQGRILWMRARIDAPTNADPAKVPLAIRVTMAGSWELYWNGVLLGRNGVPGATAAQEQAGRIRAEVYIPPDLVHSHDNVLALRVSSNHAWLRLSAPIQLISFGEYGKAVDGTPGGALALLAGGPLLLGALYFAAMFLLDRRDRASLLLSLLALAVLAQLLTESVRAFTAYPYPLHALRLVAILAFAGSSSLLLVAYVTRQLAPRHLRTALLATLAALVLIATTVAGFDGKTTLALFAGLIIAFIAAHIGARHGAAGARFTAGALAAVICVLVLTVASFIDLSYYIIATALLLFLFVRQAALLRATQLRAIQLELELLKRKIQPHFLMNTLTALSEWIESSPPTGVRMIESLAAEFRAVAAMSDASLIPMRQELDLCQHHLEVMGFCSNQTYELRDEGVNPEGMIPPAVFHTLLENALTHNRYTGGATFTLSERTEKAERIYTLRSPLVSKARTSGSGGTGHDYVRARLRAAFAERWRFESRAVDGEWRDIVAVPCAS
jgi:MFS family permease